MSDNKQVRCFYYYGCRFGNRCKLKCCDARPSNPKEAQELLLERMNMEERQRVERRREG